MSNNKGFSLIEILVTMTIFVTIVILSGDFIITGLKGSTFVSEQETAVTQARRSIEIISKEIRGTNSSELGDYPLATIDDDEFIFYSDINDDNLMERVRYLRDDTIIYKIVTPPGPLVDYDTANNSTSTIAKYINNQEEPVFIYFDNDMNDTNIINMVRLIRINIRVNVTPTIAPNDYYVETDVHLRNLKDNL